MTGPCSSTSPGRFDPLSAVMALVTVIALAGTAWLRFGPAPPAEPPGVGTPAPRCGCSTRRRRAAGLARAARAGGLAHVLVGEHAGGPSDLAALDRIWDRLKDRPQFTMVAAAVDAAIPPGGVGRRDGGRRRDRPAGLPRDPGDVPGVRGRRAGTCRCTS